MTAELGSALNAIESQSTLGGTLFEELSQAADHETSVHSGECDLQQNFPSSEQDDLPAPSERDTRVFSSAA